MMLKILSTLLLSSIGAVLYRLGGTNKGTLWRDTGVSIVTLLTCMVSGLLGKNFITNVIAYFLTFGLSWGALSAYWGQDEKKYGYFWHGLGLALAVAPICLVTGHWLGFLARLVVLPAAIAIYSQFTGNDWLEEGGRGFLIIITLLFL